MTQLSKRSLRQRRAPKPFDSENEEQDPWGYSKPSYAKEQKTPAQQLASDAKLFVRFLTSINRGWKEQEAASRKKEQEAIKEPVPVRERKGKGQGESQGVRRGREMGEGRQDSVKKSKDGGNGNRGNNPPTTAENGHLKPDAVINKYKALNHESASKMLSIESTLSKAKPLTSKPPPSGRDTTPSPSIFKNGSFLPSPSNGHHPSASFFPLSKEKQEKISALSAQLNIPKPTIAENKIFKRSAFHVAIAYHIYLNKLREKGSVGNEIDPTFYARRLKEGMHKY